MIPVAASGARTALAVGVGLGLAFLLILIVVLTGLAERAGIVGTRRAKVPAGMRPGPSDDVLERRLLERYLMWGAVITIFFAIFIPAYWLREPTRLSEKEASFLEESIARGDIYYGPTERCEGIVCGVNCLACHGREGEGGVRQFTDPVTRKSFTYAEPPLSLLVARYNAAGKNIDEIKQLVRDAIERGRPGTPMPTWGLQFGGPLNSQQVDDLLNYLLSDEFQKPAPKVMTTDGEELFQQNCAICHGANGEGGIGPNLTVELQRNTARQVFETIFGGRLNTNRPSMPSWAFLGRQAVQALVTFIQSIQVVS